MRIADLQLAKRIGHLAVLAVGAVSLTGCQVIAGAGQSAQVRFLDASPDAPGLDLYQNSAAALYNVGFGAASSYISVAPAAYSFAASYAGTRQQLASTSGTLALGAQYTVLVGNLTASLQMTLLKDQSTPAPAGQTSLRFLNQSTRTGPVDIYLVPANGALATTPPSLTRVFFNNPPGYFNLPSGTYSIVVVPSGAATTAAPSLATVTTVPTLLSGNQVVYPSASARTIVLIDQPLSTPAALQLISADDFDSPAAT